MKRFSPRLFALGLILGAISAASLLAARTYAFPTTRGIRIGSTSAQSPDQVIQWNRILLGILRTPGAQPPTAHPTRSMAILHAAIYDAVNAITRTNAPYLVNLRAPRTASEPAAVAAAAHRVLVELFPSQTAGLDADLATSLAQVPDGLHKDQGVSIGETVANRILALRSNDGSPAQPIPFTPGTVPGDYQRTPPAFAPPVFTHWPFVTPFALKRANQFRPPPPPALTGAAYAAAFDEVKDLGSINSTTRTPEQTQIARFWGAPIQNYWNEITQTVALAHGTTLAQNARLFALLDLSLADYVVQHFLRPSTSSARHSRAHRAKANGSHEASMTAPAASVPRAR